ncbi:Arc family DNA-binding protein [Bradyrhizobium sp. WD16]|uniref:Arc family DNA-binding protein n=1 Tax=Bradyrhizobium sp. WD16 TaxID=1521768 RepID=UPI0020A3C2C7|nr:Arc family DNA-binding protein [Bradyrhizobium sp. WD16]
MQIAQCATSSVRREKIPGPDKAGIVRLRNATVGAMVDQQDADGDWPERVRKVQIHPSVPEQLRENLKMSAKKGGRSLNQEIVDRLTRSLAEDGF